GGVGGVGVEGQGHWWGSVPAFRDGGRSFTDKDIGAAGRDLNLIAGRLSRAMVGGAATPQPATLPAFGSATPASCYPPQAPHQYLHPPRTPPSSPLQGGRQQTRRTSPPAPPP